MEQGLKTQTVFNFVILGPIFVVFSLFLSRWHDGHQQDFAAYWQAGRMILTGQNVYDSAQWIAVRQSEGILPYAEPTFQYPLPLGILFSPLALFPIQSAYTLWMFCAQIAVLACIAILLEFYPERSGYFELLTITGVFFFRPMFSILHSGQILTLLLLLLSISIRLFHNHNWFFGGFILSMLSLKPSLGFPVLILSGLWLLSRTQWKGIWGMISGGFVLIFIGALVNYKWIVDYIKIGGNFLHKYYGIHPTLWGVVDKIFKIDRLSLTIGFVCVASVLVVEAYLFWRNKSDLAAFPAFATILPAALLIAPYAWNYDQILLTVPIVFILIAISIKHGNGKAALFMLGIVMLAFGMVAIAYLVGHDVWSFLNSFVVWMVSLYFVTKSVNFNMDRNTLHVSL